MSAPMASDRFTQPSPLIVVVRSRAPRSACSLTGGIIFNNITSEHMLPKVQQSTLANTLKRDNLATQIICMFNR